MNKLFGLVLLPALLALLPACRTDHPNVPTAKRSASTRSRAGKVFADYYEERLRLYPLEATLAGDRRYDDSLPNSLTDSFHAQAEAFYRKHLAAVNRLEGSPLTAEERLSCSILKWECDINLKQLQFPAELLPINQFESLHLSIGQWAAGTSAQPFQTVRDYENWLKRLEAFATWSASAIARMREGMQKGYVLPRALIDKMIPQMADLAKGPSEEHLFYAPIKGMPSTFPDADRRRLATAYANLIQDRIVPTFAALHDFLVREYRPVGRSSSGIGAIPNGPAYYQLQIRFHTTTDLSAEEIFQMGQKEVARLMAEMEQVKQRVGFQGDLKSFFDQVRTKKELVPFSDPQQVIDHFNAIHATMEPGLRRLFHQVPKTRFAVRRTEAFREASASAEYIQGSLDGKRPGTFYVPIPNVTEYNILSDEDLFLHEAIPGHHYQMSLQQENTDLPGFRRILWYGAYGEGWALYCESLGSELGLYRDPYQYFGMLSAEMHRAIRLVVDVGLHAKGWTREQAIQYSLDHEAKPESSIIPEIERYMAWPGQALSYKIGQMKIRELRARAEAQLGTRFHIREFHDRILESGCLPLQLLEAKIDQWIQARRKD